MQICEEVKEVKKKVHYIPNTFTFVGSSINEAWLEGVIKKPLRACLIRNKSEFFLAIKTAPKWVHKMQGVTTDGELVEVLSNDLKRLNFNKIKAMKKFSQKYQPLYEKRKVTLLFHTFTQADKAKLSFKDMIDLIKWHYKAIGKEIRGYVWTLEVSFDKNPKGHVHYHLCVAVDRMNIRGGKIPNHLKFEKQWGRSTGVEIVKKNVVGYMSKYFAKNNAKVLGWRGYGISNSLN